MARKPQTSGRDVTRRDRAGTGGTTAAARGNQDGRFGGSTASRSRGERQSAGDAGADRRGFASMNSEQRRRAARRTAEPEWQKETQSARPLRQVRWMSAVDLIDTTASRRAPKAADKPGPSGRRGTRGQGGWAADPNEPPAQRRPRPGDPTYEAHLDTPRRPRARGRRHDSARDGSSTRGATVMDSGVGRRGAAGTQDERPPTRTARTKARGKKK